MSGRWRRRRRASRAGPALTIGETRDGPLQLPVASLARHMAIVGSTGSGKSTLLLNLALGVLDTPIGATVIDPHGDLANDILCRIPRRHADRVHVLRLADRAHPRGFNFLERHELDQAQLVASEFVRLFQDLWPDYTGPKMQHYLRHALLTLLSHPEQQTIIELVRILTDDGFREQYLEHVDDAMLRAFWRNEWPSPGGREHDASIKAVLNKLGAFVAGVRDSVADAGRDGPEKYQGRVCLPAPGDPAVAAAIVAASDRRDARPLDQVRAEIRCREGADSRVRGGADAGERQRDAK